MVKGWRSVWVFMGNNLIYPFVAYIDIGATEYL